MKNNSPQNFNCEFAPESIDFIYGEMSDDRKNAFQIHLNKCEDCAGEIRDFSDIKFSIQDWKMSEFDKIPTPKFEIPYQKVSEVVISNEKISFFDSVKNYFRFSPVLTGAAAFTVLAFLVGSAVFLIENNRGGQDVAEKTPTTNLSPTPKVINSSVNSDGEKQTTKTAEQNKTENENPSPVLADGKDKNVEKSVPLKASNKTVNEEKPQAVKTIEKKSAPNGNINNKDQKAVQTTKKPRLNDLPEDEEDNSLRLSDMFADLDTK